MAPVVLEVAGFEFAPTRARTIRSLERLRNTPDPQSLRWLLERAAVFVSADGQKARPAWNYSELSRNLRRSRGVKVSPRAVRRLVSRGAPGVFAARVQANTPEKRTHPRTGAKVPNHWLLQAHDRIRAGGHEPAVLARFGYVKKNPSS